MNTVGQQINDRAGVEIPVGGEPKQETSPGQEISNVCLGGIYERTQMIRL